MKIRAIRYQNFRNFAKCGEVTFDTDKKVSIVYGTNGDGKTTLHQLFQWILYRRVTFNKTTSESKLYNLGNGEKLTKDCSFVVWGEIEFEHDGEIYLARREYTYYKNNVGNIVHKTDQDEFIVQRREKGNDWKDIESPEILIEEVLPSGLSPYFFFDGETMIADLKIRGTDSAKTLRTALYSIFDLEAYEKALVDIGTKTRSQSAIGQLDTMRLKLEEKAATESKQKEYLRGIRILKRKVEECESENAILVDEMRSMDARLQEISELIGTSKSKKQLEAERKNYLQYRKDELGNIEREMQLFGSEIEDNYAYLLISEVVKTADARLYLEVQDEEKKIVPGLTKELLISLLKQDTDQVCICGRHIGKSETERIKEWKRYFPPASYKSTYDKFKRNAIKYSGRYDGDKLNLYLRNILKYKTKIRKLEQDIERIDDEIKRCGNTDGLIEERKKIEKERAEKDIQIKNNIVEKSNSEHQIRIRERLISGTEKANTESGEFRRKIELLEAVVEYLKSEMNKEIKDYSNMLKREIQSLIDGMLTSKREVLLNEDFQLQVMDSYGDESKSEGQFAVVSFAYIGGIFKVLKSHEKLMKKEYPLVLDGPFSKLDPEQKKNVIRVIPEYAPQVIIFSKDPLEEYIPEEKIGKIWTIVSNDEKNNAEIKEGFLWR